MSRLATLAAVGAGAYLAYRALMPRYDFRGKNVLITGGSRGLGLLMARELAARGARLAICAGAYLAYRALMPRYDFRGKNA